VVPDEEGNLETCSVASEQRPRAESALCCDAVSGRTQGVGTGGVISPGAAGRIGGAADAVSPVAEA
jgi:hypothetical protein